MGRQVGRLLEAGRSEMEADHSRIVVGKKVLNVRV